MTSRNSTKSQILSMGKAGLVSRFLLLLLTMALVRLLDVDEFGAYRSLWLLANTALLIAVLGIPNSLLYFMPRSSREEKTRYLNQTLQLTIGGGLVAALVTGPWNPLMPEDFRHLSGQFYTVPLFVLLWVVGSTVQVLPNADQQIAWQSRAIVAISIIRLILVAGIAFWTRDLEAVFLAMIAMALIQLFVLLWYVNGFHRWRPRRVRLSELKEQLAYAVPTGIAASMFQIRRLAEQWVVALMYGATAYGVFSIAVAVFPLVQLVRRPVQAVILPKMSLAQLGEDVPRLLRLNREGNVAVAFVLLPIAGAVSVLAEPLIEVMFGSDYQGAVNVLRLYCFGMIPQAIEVGTILMVFAQTRFVMTESAVLTLVGILLSVVSARMFGPVGAALGSTIVSFIGMWVRVRRAMRVSGSSLQDLQDWKRLVHALSAVLLGCAAAAAVLVAGAGDWPAWMTLGLGGLAFAAVYLGALLLMGYAWMLRAYLGRGQWVGG